MTDLRVKVDAKHFELYNDLTSAGIGSDFHTVFFVCLCVGYSKKIKSGSSPTKDKFWSRTFSPEEWACMYSLALTEWGMNYESIQDDKAVMGLMEEYASGGLEYLVKNTLKEHLIKDRSVPRLDETHTRDLPRDLLFDLWESSDS